MGHEIIYCVTCGSRLTTSDLEKGEAFRIDDMPYCAKCAPTKVPVHKPVTPPRPQPRLSDTARIRLSSSATSSKDTARATTRAFGAVKPRPRNKAALFGIIGGGIFVLVIVLVLALGSGSPRRPARPPAPPKAKVPKAKPPSPKMLAPLERARAYRRNNPDDLIGQIREYEKARWDLPSSLVSECQAELKTIKAALQKKLDVELAELEAKIAAPLQAKDFDKALEILQGSRDRHDTPLWKLAVDKKIGRVMDLRHEAGLHAPESQPPAGTLGKALLGWWKLDEGSGDTTADASGNGHDGVFKNNPSWDKRDDEGCIRLGGKNEHQFLEIPHAPSLNVGKNSFSVSFWVRPEHSFSRRAVAKRHLKKGWDVDINSEKGGANKGGRIRLYLHDGKVHDFVVDAKIKRNEWQHLAVTVDREKNEFKTYRNGDQVGEAIDISAVTGSLDSNSPVYVGYKPNGGVHTYMKGSLDDVRLYGRVLTPGEVKALAR